MAKQDYPEIVVRVVNEIVESPTSGNINQSGGVSTTSPSSGGSSSGGGRGVIGGISAQFLVKGGTKIVSAFGNNELTNTLQDAGKYAFLGARALSGDPTAVASLALDLASQAIKTVMDEVKKNAALQNDVEMAKYNQGLMSLSGVRVNKNFWTGRYEYTRE